MFKDELKHDRIVKGCTQIEYAKLLGVAVGTLRTWEQGANLPSLSTYQRLKNNNLISNEASKAYECERLEKL